MNFVYISYILLRCTHAFTASTTAYARQYMGYHYREGCVEQNERSKAGTSADEGGSTRMWVEIENWMNVDVPTGSAEVLAIYPVT